MNERKGDVFRFHLDFTRSLRRSLKNLEHYFPASWFSPHTEQQ